MKKINPSWLFLSCLLWFLALSAIANAQEPFFRAFDYLKNFELARVYSDYSALFDFFIYLFIFLGITKVVLEERFEGKGGEAIIIGIGTALALSLAVAEQRYDFNLGQISSFAAGIIILIMGFMLFQLFTKLGIAFSGMLTFVSIYFFVSAITPEFFNWIADKLPIVNLILVIAVIVSIIKIVYKLLQKGLAYFKRTEPAIETFKPVPPQAEIDKIKMNEEAMELTKQSLGYTKELIADLLKALRIVETRWTATEGKDLITRAFLGIIRKEKELLQIMEQTKIMLSKLTYDDSERIQLIEKALILSGRFETLSSNFSSFIIASFDAVRNRNIKDTKINLGYAIKTQTEIKMIIEDLVNIEESLISITNKKIKSSGREEKKVA